MARPNLQLLRGPESCLEKRRNIENRQENKTFCYQVMNTLGVVRKEDQWGLDWPQRALLPEWGLIQAPRARLD